MQKPFHLDSDSQRAIEYWFAICGKRGEKLDLDDNFKRLIKELGTAINESVSDSEKISDVIGRIRAAGYDLFLVLEVTIGFNRRGETKMVHRQKIEHDVHHVPEFHLTNQDAQFLRALKISVEKEPG
jgi:hypothetical protein